MKLINILLVEDNPGDVRLTQEALNEGHIENKLYVVKDGLQALNYLKKIGPYEDAVKPDMILLDLNIPKINGHEVLHIIKQDEQLKSIPVVILTTSSSEDDVVKTYMEHANCYITKPVDFEQFINVIRLIDEFWLTIVKLPEQDQKN